MKVWRLYPFAEEALAPLMSFYCAHTPAYMSTIKSNLCVAFQDPTTATFIIVLYNLPEKSQSFTHSLLFFPIVLQIWAFVPFVCVCVCVLLSLIHI